MATAMLVAGSNPHRMPEWIGALVLCMLTTMVVFLMATRIRKLLGEQAITALERLMGLLLTAISIEMLLSGVAAYILHIQH
jgi:small neutral amino acid transporter SnatA (MarC family)